jgi:hypothetical protein
MQNQVSDYTNDARIVAVEARTVSIPLDQPTSFSTRRVAARDYTLVRVSTADGHQGIGFCYGGSRGGVLVTHAVRELFRQNLIGQSALRSEGLWQEMYQDSLLHGRAGSTMRALPRCRCRSTSAAMRGKRCRPMPAAAITWTARRRKSWAKSWPVMSRSASRR